MRALAKQRMFPIAGAGGWSLVASCKNFPAIGMRGKARNDGSMTLEFVKRTALVMALAPLPLARLSRRSTCKTGEPQDTGTAAIERFGVGARSPWMVAFGLKWPAAANVESSDVRPACGGHR